MTFCRRVFRAGGRDGLAGGPGSVAYQTGHGARQLDIDLLQVAKALAMEFRRRQMHSHVQSLKQFAAAHRRARTVASDGPWSAQTVLTWAALLKIPPMQHLYQVHCHAVVCPGCTVAKAIMRVEVSWTGGALIRCDACGFKWLETL